jgi:uncharacterized Zn finger protein
MKTAKYEILIIIQFDGDICQASCGCPAGKGPKATCKHIAVAAYALDDFAREFVRKEAGESQTERLQR